MRPVMAGRAWRAGRAWHDRRVRWRNGPEGYGVVTKALHWSMATLLVAQFVVGYLLEGQESGRGRGRGRGGGSGRGRGRGGGYEVFGDDTLLNVHVVLGLTILVLACVRLAWRLATPLPPWAEALSARQRTLAHWVERALYLLMFAIPISGLVLVIADDDDLLGVHIAAHLAFFVVIAVHVGSVLWHQLVRGDGLLGRMT
jgi:cytochrome b561